MCMYIYIYIYRFKLALTSGASFARWGQPLAPPPFAEGLRGKEGEWAIDPNHIP